MADLKVEEGTSRRERQKQERQEQILDAAVTVFAQKGYHQATVHDVAELAGVADGTIYNYYENKFDLLIGLLSRIAELESLPAELVDGLQCNARDFFVAAFQHRLDRIEEGEEILHALLPQVLMNPELREQFYRQYVQRIAAMLEGYITAQVERGRMRPVNPQMLVRLVQGTFVGLLLLRIMGDETLRDNWRQVPEFLAGILFDGLELRAEG